MTAIVAYDLRLSDAVNKLFVAKNDAAAFAYDKKLALETALGSSFFPDAYLIVAARALGIDVCSMLGSVAEKVDAAFFEATHRRTNFLCVFGYASKQVCTFEART